MRTMKASLMMSMISALLVTIGAIAVAQQAPAVKSVEINPTTAEGEIGQKMTFTAVAKDADGKRLDLKPSAWFAAPFDTAAVDEGGTVTFYNPGEVRIGAMIGGKAGYAKIVVKPARVARVEIDPPPATLAIGASVKLNAIARTAGGDPKADATVTWTSGNPEIATVDPAGLVTGIKIGRVLVRAVADGVEGTAVIGVAANPVRGLSIEPGSTSARTGDVVRFKAVAKDAAGGQVKNASIRWAVGEGAIIENDGAFVAERPGSYVVTASCGERAAVASVVVTQRNVEREAIVVGRAPVKDFMAAEEWIIGNYAYMSTISDKILVYDVTDPASPKLTDTIKVDARIVNDVTTTTDGKIMVISREGASNRKNGIAFFDTSNPAHPKPISEYTATVSGGVHSAFVDGHYVYLTDDATGSMRVIDFGDVKNPKEVARWEAPSSIAAMIKGPGGATIGGRYLHDVQVKDGLAYLAYWRDGLVILDVGSGIKGGSPEKPVLVSHYRFNHYELYGAGWLAGAHAVFRYKNYVFVGDEVFPAEFDIVGKSRFPVRGIVHVIDVSDIAKPRKVAEYVVPEGGSHNIWVKDDVMYMGYYSAGARIVDVSGELRGDLYRQGREIARVWTGDQNGYRSNLPFCWGAQPQGELVFFNDINSGLWIVKLGKPVDKGSTTTPGN